MRRVWLLGLVLLAGCASGAGEAPGAGPPPAGPTERVGFPAAPAIAAYPRPGAIGQGAAPGRIPATLRLPPGEGRVPAVIVLHSTAGVGAVTDLYAEALRRAGFATLVPDMWTARGMQPGAYQQRRPSSFAGLQDAFGAARFLAAHPRIDPQRIGVTGQSFGAIVALRAAREDVQRAHLPDGPRLGAFAPVYPACSYWMPGAGASAGEFDQGWPAGPMLILAAGQEDYDRAHGGADCAGWLDALPGGRPASVTLRVFPDATHGWDVPEGRGSQFFDPGARNAAGGFVTIRPNPAVREEALRQLVAFFQASLAPR
jgi:dienelactone hydrolase